MNFDKWFQKLLNVNMTNGQHGLHYPMGSCCYRDVVRDKKVKAALKDAWNRIIENGEDPDDEDEFNHDCYSDEYVGEL